MSRTRLLVGLLALSSACESAPVANDAPTGDDTAASDASGPTSNLLSSQDVTVLYPFPTAADLTAMLDATSGGPRGELIPQAVFAMLPQVVTHPLPRENAREETRLVGIRANCAFDTETRADACAGQLQLVFQVLVPAPDGVQAEVFDASIHAVYPLDDTTFLALVRDLLALRQAEGGYDAQALSVHPILARQGIEGDFGRGLAEIVLRYAGAETLHKVTFISIDEPTPDARGARSGPSVRSKNVTVSSRPWRSLRSPPRPPVSAWSRSVPPPPSQTRTLRWPRPPRFLSRPTSRVSSAQAASATAPPPTTRTSSRSS